MGDGGAKPCIHHAIKPGRNIHPQIAATEDNAGTNRCRAEREGGPPTRMQPIAHAPNRGLERLAPSILSWKKTVHLTLQFRAAGSAKSRATNNPCSLSHDRKAKAIQALFLRVSV
jgi:hypothetical protein